MRVKRLSPNCRIRYLEMQLQRGELEKPPVWSLLRERSFFWKTFEKDLGIHELRFQAITKERGDTLAYPIQLIIL